jgi:hypothetical protein
MLDSTRTGNRSSDKTLRTQISRSKSYKRRLIWRRRKCLTNHKLSRNQANLFRVETHPGLLSTLKTGCFVQNWITKLKIKRRRRSKTNKSLLLSHTDQAPRNTQSCLQRRRIGCGGLIQLPSGSFCIQTLRRSY